jgi:hypothetical protein
MANVLRLTRKNVRFAVANREKFLTQYRKHTTFEQRKAINPRLMELFTKAEVAVTPQLWTLAQAAIVTKGIAGVARLLKQQ